MKARNAKIRDFMTISPVIPVLTIQQLEHAVPLARALVRGGLSVLEVTLRTACALEAIRADTRCGARCDRRRRHAHARARLRRLRGGRRAIRGVAGPDRGVDRRGGQIRLSRYCPVS